MVGEEEFDFVVRNLISNNAQKLHSAKNASKRNPIRKKKGIEKILIFCNDKSVLGIQADNSES